jgi:hypothetical protein
MDNQVITNNKYIRNYNVFRYRNYSMYGSHSNVCGRRCIKIINSKIWTDCKCNYIPSFKNN